MKSNLLCLHTLVDREYLIFMDTTVEKLAEQAMSLPTESRARLADILVESLDGDQLGTIDQLWLSEVKRRHKEVRSGRIKTIPGEEALQKVRDAIRR
jgi:putative addiction module component (TIGR02574 family)